MAVRLQLLFPRSVVIWLSQSPKPQQALVAFGVVVSSGLLSLLRLGIEIPTVKPLVAWSTRNPTKTLPGTMIVNTTVIPARSFALILSPSYADAEFPYIMPYTFPSNTVILTAAESRSLGDDASSIVGEGQGRDVLVLFKGGPSVIQETISTYGTPKPAQYVSEIKDNYIDSLPLDLHECSSVERIVPTAADSAENWREVQYGSPGEAPY